MSKQKMAARFVSVIARTRRRLQTLAFAVLYRFGGRVYDSLTVLLFGDSWDRWRQMIVPLIGEGPVLDLGCGTGMLVARLAELGYHVVGIDREPSMLARATDHTVRDGHVVRADATCLPFAGDRFQTCVATFPSSFIFEMETLDEVARVLAPGGRFAVVLTGQTDRYVWWRLPIRLLLRLFYGDSRDSEIPNERLLRHPLMSGEWKWLADGDDKALLWVATREGS